MVLAPYRTVMQLVRTPDGASVERVHAGGRGACSSQFPQKVEALLCFFGQRKVNLIATPIFFSATQLQNVSVVLQFDEAHSSFCKTSIRESMTRITNGICIAEQCSAFTVLPKQTL